jgi:hypothetical protein
LTKHLQGNEYVSLTSTTADDLVFKVQPYAFTLRDTDTMGCSYNQPWILVRVIDFGLNIPILNDGMVFVDSPGLSDANRTRANNARKYHTKCTHKLHIANVGRAASDKSIRQALVQAHRRGGTKSIILVLTHGDDIDMETNVTGNSRALKREHDLRKEYEVLIDERDDLLSKKRMLRKDEGVDIEVQLDQVKSKSSVKKQELDVFRLRMRNEATKNKIAAQYKELTGDPHPLPVYLSRMRHTKCTRQAF